MTEKRFKQVVNGVKDTRTGRTLTSPLDFTLKLNEINDLYDWVFDRNEELENENEQLKSTLQSERRDLVSANNEYRNKLSELEKENEQLKQFIQELTTKGTAKIHLANGSIYKVDAILSDFKGDME